MKVGDILVVRPLCEIKQFEFSECEDFFSGKEFVVRSIDKDMGMVYTRYNERYSLEKDKNGLSWETFFILKEV